MKRLVAALIVVLLILVAAGLYLIREKRTANNRLTLYGNVDVRQVDLGFRVLGKVESMPFQEGDSVKAGTKMGSLDKQPFKDEVLQAKANLLATKVSLENQKRLVARRKEIVDQGAASREEYETAISNKNVLLANLEQGKAALGVAMTNFQDTDLYAPADGTILTRIREPGAIVNVGEPIYTLSLVDPIWIRAFVSESDLGRIYPGMKAKVYTDANKVYEGHIGFISPVAEFTPKTVETKELRTDLVYRLRIIADNPDHFLKQGMPVTVKLKL